MDHDSTARLVTAAVAARVFGRDGVRLARRLLAVGVRIGIDDLVTRTGLGRSAETGSAPEGER
ncbi:MULTISPECIES: hypothetical protein [Streptomycetaceae]|uniref:hypothetical protein n=1 Tax=Streptomycetaceae TaxID=2062 RepID=UPI00093EEA8B|nr:hypothetical protein [Streptomyces sp. CB02056]OKH97561.1 hypothetical protein AMK13_38340 [Streptomyces sp. CB02056]